MRYVLLFLISCFSCLASTVTGPIADLAGLGFNPRVEFWPLSTPYNSGNTNVVGPMKSVQAVSGNFSQVLLAGRYLVKFPPTTNSFIIIVPNDNSTYSLSTLSSNVASVSSITSTYFITSNQFASALTNQDTRNVTFLGTVASSGFQGDGNGLTELDADNLIYGSIPIGRISDGLITSNKLDATAYVAFMGGGSGSSIAAGTNIVTVTNGSLVTVHGTANVTQAGLAAGSYLFGNILLTNGYFSVQTGSTNYDWMIFTNGTLALPAYNTSETTIERGISFFNTNSTLSSRIITWADHTGTPNTPEMMLECSGGVALKPGAINIGTFNRPFIQLGHNGNVYGAYTFMSSGPAGIVDGLPNSLTGQGHSSALIFRAIGTNGVPAYVYNDPGIIGSAGGDQSEVYGPGGQMSARGKLGFYTVAPIFNGTSYSSYPGIMVFEMGTNYLAMQGTNQFIGNAAGVTNQNYAIFQQIIASGAAHTTFPSATFTNVNWTTNAAALSFDSGAAFTLSNNVIIVNSSGAGRWRVRSSVPFYNNNSGSSGACMTRLYRINNTPSSLAQGQSVYQYGYSCPDSRINAVVTLAAGDVFAIQAWAASTADTQIGVTNGSGENHAGAILEMERQ